MKKVVGVMLLLAVGNAVSAELHIGSWPDYLPDTLIKKFQAETGIKTTLDTYASDAALTQKLQSGGGGYDVVIAGDYYVPVLVKSGLLQKLDKNKLPNIANIKPEYRHPSFDPKRDYAMPYTVVLTGFAYDSARVSGGKLDESWKSFFDPPAELRGQIGDLDVEEELYMAASWYLGQDECTENPADAKRVLDVLQKQKPFVKTYSNDGTIDRLASKQIVVQHIWSGAAARAQDRLPSITFVYPKEGVRLFMDSLLIPAKARNTDSAYQFVNWMMRPENIAQVTNAVRYNNEIIGSERYIDAALLKNPAIKTPEQYKARLRPYKMCSPTAIQLRNKVWLKLKGNR
ncbi:extracellular solute-binding protein [Burkholderia oklahomensis]|uniref:extracellular solute-binding protein n=1 Tax=Burkholderia oklahomensis TaxID=342113 RepID=UPI00016A8688|nr:extracellular solute-binding protein [Burkholderia oklahomensis]AJX32636.1 bacterial extracellular solute-binding family protein [Burkholderia oklahomensis C6786]AOI44691.1 spermidine/putrescine ABC transporter substrate-binding protein [Burkholderia oklahomensis C6786]KUY63380.1 spermidine/putrescine ABC transporter substrate-binding protein [Burkholderia oklahomensis C6786]MBI0359301.1 extracellular solute-binding protein [Burkholderia oklahomensis]SUW58246.1 Putrescine-binding periplasmi